MLRFFIGIAALCSNLALAQFYGQQINVDVYDTCAQRIQSNDYPNGYTVDSATQWTLNTDSDKMILLTFSDVDLDRGNCDTNVVVTDYDGQELVKYCGQNNDMPEAIMVGAQSIITFNVAMEPESGRRGFTADVRIFAPLEKILRPVTATTKAPTAAPTPAPTTASTAAPPTTTRAVSTTTTRALEASTSSNVLASYNLPSGFSCGVPMNPTVRLMSSAQTRIIAGQPALPGEFPWMLQMRYKTYGAICGASLINARYAVGALHCFAGAEASDKTAYLTPSVSWSILAGAYTRENNPSAIPRGIKKIHVHPDMLSLWKNDMNSWTPSTGSFDIVLIELDQPLYPSTNVSYICMPKQDYSVYSASTMRAANISCVASGWGVTQPGVFPSNSLALQKVTVPLVDRTNCVNLYQYEGRIWEDMMCAANLTGIRSGNGDSCQGDSGGPLQCRKTVDGVGPLPYELSGVVSWGIGCGDATKPGVYTNTYKYLNWINSVVGSEPLFHSA